MKVRHYQELIVWQKAMDLVEDVYEVSKAFPREETYGLTSQLRKAAVQSPPTSLRDKVEQRRPTFFDISQLHMDLCWRLRLSC